MNKKPVIFRLLSYAPRHLPLLVFGLIFITLGTAAGLVAPILIGRAIDSVVVADGGVTVDMALIGTYSVITAALVCASGILVWLSNILLSKLSFVMVRDIRNELFGKLLTLPLSYIDTKSRGDIMMRMTTFGENLSEGVYQGVMHLSSGIVALVVTVCLMFMLNWIVSLVVIGLTPLSALVSYFVAKRNRVTFKRQSELMSEMSGNAEEYIAGSRLVRAYGKRAAAEAEFEEINAQLFKSGVASQFAGAMVNPLSRIVNSAVYAAVAIAGCVIAVAYASGDIGVVMTAGTLSVFLTYATQFAKPFNDVTAVTAEIQTATAAGKKIFEIIDNADEDKGGGMHVEPPVDAITFTDGAFSYGDKPFIEGLNIFIEGGKKVALVGSTGSGKTTVINLIMRFYDLSGGTCIFDGHDITRYDRVNVRKCFGMVLQDTWLFEGTIKENIAYGKENAGDGKILAAARAAYLDGFINTLPDGYDTVITGDAEQLSEGQKQLITIARLLLAAPEMLILDEATASVDAMTEKAVQLAFAEILAGKTTITVAHRLSTIRDYDLIIVMDKGRIIEQGTHDELVANNGYYCEMLEASGIN